MREERTGGRLVDQRSIAECGKVGAVEPLVDQIGELGGGAADGQIAQRLALVSGVGRVAVDDVAGQRLHVAGHVERRRLADDRLQVAEIGGAEGAVGVHALRIWIMSLRLSEPSASRPWTSFARAGSCKPGLTTTRHRRRAGDRAALGGHRTVLPAVLGAVNRPAAVIVPPLAVQVKPADWPSPDRIGPGLRR